MNMPRRLSLETQRYHRPRADDLEYQEFEVLLQRSPAKMPIEIQACIDLSQILYCLTPMLLSYLYVCSKRPETGKELEDWSSTQWLNELRMKACQIQGFIKTLIKCIILPSWTCH